MKVFKAVMFFVATLALVVSLAPQLAAQPGGEEHQPANPPIGGGSGGQWTVTCVYNGQEVLISKTCSSGGTSSCNCP